ncbi:MAG: alkaline phosphatase D family protein [Balneolaceae bacterium]|nr:alkaline phosphatase D family protein [Balneolaceae bacterium]
MRKTAVLFVLPFFLFVNIQAQQNDLLEAGPMLGHVEFEEVNLWLQTTSPASFEITYWPKGEEDSARSYKGTTNTRASNTAHIKLANLSEGTTYEYDIFVNDTKMTFSYATEFATQKQWKYRTAAPNVTLAMGSCLYINDPEDDRPGDGYGGDPAILETIADMNPDLMLWLGDNLYYREPDFYTEEQMDARYKDARNTPEMQRLLATSANLATWDDHDYGPNNSSGTYRMKEASLNIFKRYWANPSYGIKGTDGVFSRYKYSDIEIFLMDDRYHRAPNQLKNPKKPFFGKEQLQWLTNSLIDSDATFKLVVVGNQVTNKKNDFEAMASYKQEFNRLKTFLKNQDVEGVVFLSGDRHFSELLKTERKDRYPLYEFTSSPLTAGNFDSLDEYDEFDNPQRVDGTVVYKERSFGIIKVEGGRGERKLILQTYNKAGDKLWEHVITQQELEN